MIEERCAVLVTGVAGFIGSAIAKDLVERGYVVFGIDNLSTGSRSNIPEDVNFIEADCANPEIFSSPDLLGSGIKVVVHFAGQSSGEISFDDPMKDLSDNCLSTLALLDFCRKIECRKFIFASSMSVYGDVPNEPIGEGHRVQPLSMYAVGKLASEHYLRLFARYEIQSVALRLFNVYGPGQNLKNLRQGMISIYLAQALSSGAITVKGDPLRFRDFVYIDDVVDIVSRLCERELEGAEIVNVCSGVATSVKDLLALIQGNLPTKVLKITYEESTPGDQFGIFGSNHKLLRLIGNYEFTNLNHGLAKFVQHASIDY